MSLFAGNVFGRWFGIIAASLVARGSLLANAAPNGRRGTNLVVANSGHTCPRQTHAVGRKAVCGSTSGVNPARVLQTRGPAKLGSGTAAKRGGAHAPSRGSATARP